MDPNETPVTNYSVTLAVMDMGEAFSKEGHDPIIADGGEIAVTVHTPDGEIKFLMPPQAIGDIGQGFLYAARKGLMVQLRQRLGRIFRSLNG